MRCLKPPYLWLPTSFNDYTRIRKGPSLKDPVWKVSSKLQKAETKNTYSKFTLPGGLNGVVAIDPGFRRFITYFSEHEAGFLDDTIGLEKMAHFLCRGWSDILLPRVPNQHKWSKHQQFATILIKVASMYTNCGVYFVNEAYTSITCNYCGKQNKPSKDPTLQCSKCGLISDRDIRAARGIFIRNIEAKQLL